MPTGNLDYEGTQTQAGNFITEEMFWILNKVTGNIGPDQEAHIVLGCEEAPVTGNSVDVE